MGTPAGLLNRRVSFLRRAMWPSASDMLRGGFEPWGDVQWGGFRPRGTAQTSIGGLQLSVSKGVLTVRDNQFTRTLAVAHRVEVDGDVWLITGRQLPEKPDGMIRFDVQQAPTSATYHAEFEGGEVVTIRRVIANQPATPFIEARARAVITGYRPEEIAGGIQFGHSRIILSAEDLRLANWPEPPRANDKILLGGKSYNVLAVDANTHRIAGTLFAYEIQAAG